MFRSAGPNNLYSPAATSDSSGFSELHAYNNYSTFNPVNNSGRNLESSQHQQQRCSSPQVPHSYHNPTLMASPYSTLPRRMTSHSTGKIYSASFIAGYHTLTVFENHRESLIQHCERSELPLLFERTKVH